MSDPRILSEEELRRSNRVADLITSYAAEASKGAKPNELAKLFLRQREDRTALLERIAELEKIAGEMAWQMEPLAASTAWEEFERKTLPLDPGQRITHVLRFTAIYSCRLRFAYHPHNPTSSLPWVYFRALLNRAVSLSVPLGVGKSGESEGTGENDAEARKPAAGDS